MPINTKPIFFILTLLLSLYTLRLVGPLSVADFGAMLFIFISLLKFRSVVINDFNVVFLVWVLVSLISSLGLIYEDYFTVTGFLGTGLRILVSMALLLCLPLWLKSKEEQFQAIGALLSIVIFHSIVQLVFVALFYLNKAPFLNLVPHGDQSSRQEWLNVYDYTFYTRFGGVFEEPSWYSWFMVACIGLIISFEIVNRVSIITKRKWLLILSALFFTYSIAGIASIVILIAYKILSGSIRAKIRSVVFISIALPALILLNPDSALLKRLMGVFSGTDGSSNTRIFDSFTKLKLVLENNMTGTGIGNSIEGIYHYDVTNSFTVISTQNGFIEAFVSTGLIGGAIFMVPFVYFLCVKKYWLSLITMTLVLFTTSALFIVVMWFFMALAYLLFKDLKINPQPST